MQAKNFTGEIPIRYIKGVGPKKGPIFAKIGIENVTDLFYYLPRRYEDRSRVVRIKDLEPGEERAVTGEILKTSLFTAGTGTSIFEVLVGDDSGKVCAVWYNMPYMKNTFSLGQKVLLYGRAELQRRLQITHPVYEVITDDGKKESLEVGRIVPIYPLTADISQKYMRRTVYRAIEAHVGEAREILPTYLRARRKLADIKFAVRNIHFPYSFDNLAMAYKRLVFEEFFVLQTVMAARRMARAEKGIAHKAGEGLMTEFEKLFSFRLTDGQKRTIKEIEKDMSLEKPMYRLLQGDVGSGKTVVAMYASFLAYRNGHQAVIMAPTEILARQHFITLSEAFMPLGMDIRLLAGGIAPGKKAAIMNEIKSGTADIVIGTHSVLQEDIEFGRLGLIVIDEQHKFGVDQRKALQRKSINADTLVMTATPIPRSLALSVYGDMDISVLKEKPALRGPVATFWAGEEERDSVYAFLRGEIKKGRQSFIVCPRISEGGRSKLASARGVFAHLKDTVLGGFRSALIHGKMPPEEKDRVMEAFREGKHDILVTTTIIEVGVDVPNATFMLIEHAERYGLAQLHQLRGRIGRGTGDSYCVLMGEAGTEAGSERLSEISRTDDGFEIAEKDLDLRGPGEFLGTRQSGLPELRFGNIVKDFEIMEEARDEAFSLIARDPELREARHEGIRAAIRERFGKRVP